MPECAKTNKQTYEVNVATPTEDTDDEVAIIGLTDSWRGGQLAMEDRNKYKWTTTSQMWRQSCKRCTPGASSAGCRGQWKSHSQLNLRLSRHARTWMKNAEQQYRHKQLPGYHVRGQRFIWCIEDTSIVIVNHTSINAYQNMKNSGTFFNLYFICI